MKEIELPAGQRASAFLEKALPTATLFFAVLILSTGLAPLRTLGLCALSLGLSLVPGNAIRRLPPGRRRLGERLQTGLEHAFVFTAILWCGPGTLLWTLHFLPILRAMVVFPDRLFRSISTLTLAASAGLAEHLAGAPLHVSLQPVILLAIPAFVVDGLFRHFQKQVAVERAQRREQERRLRLASRMEAVGSLASGLAHEINTPVQYVGDSLAFIRRGVTDLLTLVKRFQSILDPGVAGDAERVRALQTALLYQEAQLDTPYLSDRLPKALERSVEGLERVAELVRSVRRFSHPGSAEPQREDLNEAVRATVTVASAAWREVAELELDLRPIPPVLCNVGELSQAVLNLLVNAADAIRAKFSPQKGRICVRTRREGRLVRLEVIDNGEGISPEIVERVFDPFFTTKQVGEGTGQGLTLAQTVIERQHGGLIQISSRPGEGTTVQLVLPIDGKEDEHGSPPRRVATPSRAG